MILLGGERMQNNMCITDRVTRILLAVLIAGLYYLGYISGAVAIILGLVAVIFIVTGFLGICPMIHLFLRVFKR
jgi:hypothetical protein